MPSIDGLVSGIDTQTIIQGLLKVQQSQIDQFNSRRAGVTQEKTSFSGVEARLIGLRGKLARLGSAQNTALRSKVASSSHEELVAAAATSKAAVGSYSLTVNTLARAHQVGSQGLSDPDAEITQGTLTLRAGSGVAKTLTIDASNNTLQGLADAINTADAGITASIVNDGSTGGAANRLVLTSNRTGTANEISVTNNLAASAGAAVQPVFDLGNPVQAATDASVTLGEGAGAITVANSTNQLDGLIPGVSLSLKKADPTTPVTLDVGVDSEAAKTAVQDFVDAYNDVLSYIGNQTTFNPASNQGGPLLGNRSVNDILDAVRLSVTGAVGGLNPAANRLSSLGISVGSNGQLSFNAGRLDDVLNGRVDGVTADDAARLFALDGVSSSPGARFILGSVRTTEGTVQVDITSAAERARITGSSSLAGSIVIDSSNNTFQLRLDGRDSTTLTIAEGTYTPQQLASKLESTINADQELLGRRASVLVNGGNLVITSDAYGKNSEVKILGGTALASLGFTGTESDIGQDVVGHFLVDGVEEPAIGSGQLLSGKAENAHTADLQIRSTFTTSQLVSGPEATLTITRGLAARLDNVLDDLLDPVHGKIKTSNDSYDAQLKSIQDSVDRLNDRFTASQESLLKQFAALESNLSKLQSTGNLLAAQLSGVSGLGG